MSFLFFLSRRRRSIKRPSCIGHGKLQGEDGTTQLCAAGAAARAGGAGRGREFVVPERGVGQLRWDVWAASERVSEQKSPQVCQNLSWVAFGSREASKGHPRGAQECTIDAQAVPE